MQQNINQLKDWLASKIVGQEHLVERLMIALLADGHLLVEGAPGLAKTKAIKTLSEGMDADFHRVQFTPDLLPADITGSDIYRPQQGSFEFQAGPLFHNLVLADEINRAPAKVLSRQEALQTEQPDIEPLTQETLFAARKQVLAVHMAEPVEEYLVQLILATRNTSAYGGDLALWLDFGASPRATIALDRCSRALAWMEGRDFVTPDDIRAVAQDVLRHRLILSFEAEAAGITANQVIDKLLATVPSA